MSYYGRLEDQPAHDAEVVPAKAAMDAETPGTRAHEIARAAWIQARLKCARQAGYSV